MSGVRYRTATVADAAGLGALGRRAFTETFGHLYTPENLEIFLRTHLDERWAARLADPGFTVRLAEERK